MFLFIFESIGTSELILIGIIALIFLGPRKLPSIAKTIGKTMADLRNTTNEFKATWEREVDFEEEARAFTNLDDEPVPREGSRSAESEPMALPDIRPAESYQFEEIPAAEPEQVSPVTGTASVNETLDEGENTLSDKSSWL